MADPITYTFHFPFSIQSQYGIAGLSAPHPIPVVGAAASLGPDPAGYAITVRGLPSSASAHEMVPRAWLGLTTMMLDTKAAFSASTDVHAGTAVTVANPDLPERFQGPKVVVNEKQPYVVPDTAPLLTVGVGDATFSVATPTNRVTESIARGMSHPDASSFFTDDRFRTAVDLFAAAAFEASKHARLLTFAMALEVLAPSRDKHAVALDVIDAWQADLARRRQLYAAGTDEAFALDSLGRELLFRRQTSIRSRIRDFVTEVLAAAGASDAPEVARKAVDGYDTRSTLVHQGALSDQAAGPAIEDLRDVLERVFAARLALPAV